MPRLRFIQLSYKNIATYFKNIANQKLLRLALLTLYSHSKKIV